MLLQLLCVRYSETENVGKHLYIANRHCFKECLWWVANHRLLWQHHHIWSNRLWEQTCESLGEVMTGTKYNSQTKAFVSTSSMLFVSAGYDDSSYEPWLNSVWGEAKQKWNSLHPKRPRSWLTQKEQKERELTQEVNMSRHKCCIPPDACSTAVSSVYGVLIKA